MDGHRNVKKLSHFLSKDRHFMSDLRTSLLSDTFLLGACEPIHIFVCKGKTAVVVLKISGAGHRTQFRRPEFVHPCANT